jgi:transcriptional regulator with XRE-family HTH domain
MTFGEKLRSLRDARGWSRQELADRCGTGISMRAITQWELNERQPVWGAVQRLCRALEVACGEFMDTDLPPPRGEGVSSKAAKAKRPPGRPRKGKAEE